MPDIPEGCQPLAGGCARHERHPRNPRIQFMIPEGSQPRLSSIVYLLFAIGHCAVALRQSQQRPMIRTPPLSADARDPPFSILFRTPHSPFRIGSGLRNGSTHILTSRQVALHRLLISASFTGILVVAVTATQVVGFIVPRPAPQHPGASATRPISGRGPAPPKSQFFPRRFAAEREKGNSAATYETEAPTQTTRKPKLK
jgi:hypothetical protein